ncbi:hypothetical protein F5Y13DRAFT_205553 [Hypoxylon sp. FL1857]|nr:hypothetical protein F5Y13DRAFT_205553 [Hypoxylon sp. FL1857]
MLKRKHSPGANEEEEEDLLLQQQPHHRRRKTGLSDHVHGQQVSDGAAQSHDIADGHPDRYFGATHDGSQPVNHPSQADDSQTRNHHAPPTQPASQYQTTYQFGQDNPCDFNPDPTLVPTPDDYSAPGGQDNPWDFNLDPTYPAPGGQDNPWDFNLNPTLVTASDDYPAPDGQSTFNGQPYFDEQSTFNGQPYFDDQSTFNEQSTFHEHAAPDGQSTFHEHTASGGQPNFDGQSTFNEQAASGGQPNFDGQSTFNEQAASGGQSTFHEHTAPGGHPASLASGGPPASGATPAPLPVTDNVQDDNSTKKKVECDECRKFYASAKCLKEHVQYIHIGKTCHWPGCDHEAASEGALCEHLSRDHTKPTRRMDGDKTYYTCPWHSCDKTEFRSESSATRCVRKHIYDKKTGS